MQEKRKKSPLRVLEEMMTPVEETRAQGLRTLSPRLQISLRRQLDQLPEPVRARVKEAINSGSAENLQETLFTVSEGLQPVRKRNRSTRRRVQQ
jgi:hypothetical protein